MQTLFTWDLNFLKIFLKGNDTLYNDDTKPVSSTVRTEMIKNVFYSTMHFLWRSRLRRGVFTVKENKLAYINIANKMSIFDINA